MIKNPFGKIASGAMDKAKELIDKSKEIAVNVADQNDDGKLDFKDISSMAGTIGNAVGDGSAKLVNKVKEFNENRDINNLRPLFIEDIKSPDFKIPKLVQIEQRDKKYLFKDVCQGSIGANASSKSYEYMKIFQDSIDEFGLEFYPDNSCDVYFRDPSDNERYIALNEYFSYLKVERINELQRIARDLGARYFKVTLKEEISSDQKSKVSKKISIPKFSGEQNKAHEDNKYSSVAIEAEMEFPPHLPVRPTLKYFCKDPIILNLVEMRLDKNAPIISQKFMLKMSNSSGMKETEAVLIDGAVKGLKLGIKNSVSEEAKKESRKYLEYEIIFD